ncbi:MAG: hypothetical protein JSW14_06885 [Candidatus Bathyarchaeum sp.]|nr:MAG: hypothetical protein JSW14_06885 [Candidatus Bathyarchaeum sp.]
MAEMRYSEDALFLNLIPMQHLFIFLILILGAFLTLLFLPSILELRNPKDAVPRRIAEISAEQDEYLVNN